MKWSKSKQFPLSTLIQRQISLSHLTSAHGVHTGAFATAHAQTLAISSFSFTSSLLTDTVAQFSALLPPTGTVTSLLPLTGEKYIGR